MSIHQEVTINASPKAVFDILLDGEKFAKMTGGAEANISTTVGGAISLFGGAIGGVNVELVPGKRVVQTWRSMDWPEGVHSLITFELSADGSNTKVSFDQVGHPDGAEPHLEKGWHDMYWNPMNAMVG